MEPRCDTKIERATSNSRSAFKGRKKLLRSARSNFTAEEKKRSPELPDDEIEYALLEVDFLENDRLHFAIPRTKETKLLVRRYKEALQRARIAFTNLPNEVLIGFQEIDFKKEENWCQRILSAASSRPKRWSAAARVKPESITVKGRKVVRVLLNPGGSFNSHKLLAANKAAYLLSLNGITPKTTRGGFWCKLAAIIYGDAKANLSHQCCELAKARKRV